MNQWGQLFRGFVDGAIDTADEASGRDEILAHLNTGTLVPGRYMYSTDLGANNWIRLCNDPMYRHHREAVDFWANSAGSTVATAIHEALGRDDLDYISLGPGAGEKDAELVGHWLASNIDVFYYPYDISRVLVSKASSTVRASSPRKAQERLRVKAVLADFSHFDAIRDVFSHRDSPNVVALLGSLGNLEHELRFLRGLKRQMSSEDLLVLEVRLKSRDEQVTELTDGDAALRFDFGALEGYLGLAFDKELMTIQREHDVSSIKDTVTTVVGCENLEYRGVCYPRVKLMYIHQYIEDTFLEEVTKAGFELVVSERGGRDESFLVCVLKKR